MVKSASMRDVGAWFEVASGRTRPRGNAVRGKTPACRSSHENVIFVRTNPSRSKQSLRIIPSCEDFSRRTPCRRKKERTLARSSRSSAQMGSETPNSFCVKLHHLPAHFAHWLVMFHSAIPDSVVPLLLREKSDSTENSEEPINSIKTPIHKQLTFQGAALPVSPFTAVQA